MIHRHYCRALKGGLIILAALLPNYLFANNLDEEIKRRTDSLRVQGIEEIVVHKYSLFNGRYAIPYEDRELLCDDLPVVVHIFWSENKKWKCLRLDKCGVFSVVELNKINFDKLNIDNKIAFKK